ncbi:MAG: hypothetical protein ACJA0X_001961 [Cyclobacteriaceae bacterium]|jgi:hypothetical protein
MNGGIFIFARRSDCDALYGWSERDETPRHDKQTSSYFS